MADLDLIATDGRPLELWRDRPVGTPVGSVLLLHGIQSHAGWYANSRKALASAGWDTAMLDRRGSGHQNEFRGDTPSWRQLVRDVCVALDALPTRPRVVAGISWGAKLALAAARLHPDQIDGVALLAPGLCPLVQVPFLKRMKILLTRIIRPTSLFDIPLNDPNMFTNNPHWLEYLTKDSLGLHQATARFLVESVLLDNWLVWGRWKLPVLVQLAGYEKIIDNRLTRHWVRRRTSGPTRILEYPRACHTLEFEHDSSWRTDFIKWLEELRKIVSN
jgi:alpha-beta hydrolase superfamily lysophospholipase